ncbi:TB2/DP1/HVA22-related protein [Dioscorea alata]|uniref:TB2/DP1/HVA22-related protein n=1 Tax=Dioscorea alata TaxID=55571 RepID=A0ACB7TSH0_DIOAL|nr:TB2/DP1/HVA22-related protein [Dioscorea alata]
MEIVWIERIYNTKKKKKKQWEMMNEDKREVLRHFLHFLSLYCCFLYLLDVYFNYRTIFGYVYLAYECYKTMKLNRPEIEQLRFWCQYWLEVVLMKSRKRSIY